MVTSSLSDLEKRVYSQVTESGSLGLIVDMDDTVFWELDFIGPFIERMSRLLEMEMGSALAENFSQFYMQNWTRGSRRDLFQRSISEFGITGIQPEDFLEEMKTLRITSGLKIRSWADRIFSESSVPIAILTNGNPDVQKNKFSQLTPRSALDRATLVCAKEICSKPSPLAVQVILDSWKLSPEDVVFIGDSEIDDQCARNSGCRFISST